MHACRFVVSHLTQRRFSLSLSLSLLPCHTARHQRHVGGHLSLHAARPHDERAPLPPVLFVRARARGRHQMLGRQLPVPPQEALAALRRQAAASQVARAHGAGQAAIEALPGRAVCVHTQAPGECVQVGMPHGRHAGMRERERTTRQPPMLVTALTPTPLTCLSPSLHLYHSTGTPT